MWADEEGPGIAMTRTLGDLQAKKIGLISEPEIQHLELQRTEKIHDKFIVIGSDGVWDVMTSAEGGRIILKIILYCKHINGYFKKHTKLSKFKRSFYINYRYMILIFSLQ